MAEAGGVFVRVPSLIFFALIFTTVVGNSQKLILEEVDALRRIAVELNNTKWNFSTDPCSGTAGWVDPPASNPNVLSHLTCACNATSRICRVVAIQLKGQNLTVVLPDEFSNLTLLSVLDLTRNLLKGSIPRSWASLPLTQLFLHGNRISGNIPEELGSIPTLQTLTLEDNQLQGSVPAALGNLINLKRLLLSANNLTGVLPDSLGKLKQLTDFRIDGNPVTGKIPEFMGNWTALQRLDMQGTSMEGPFPAIFSTLSNITVLRVSDLKIGDGKFPPLQGMGNMQVLVLRNLSISGQLPDFVGEMADLQVLDLSFNNLSGPIPHSYERVQDTVDFLYFTNNKLTGTIPNWILSSKKNIDISFNSFTGPSKLRYCQQGNVNLVSSYSTTNSNLIPACLKRNYPCSDEAKNYKLFINCGGSKVTVGDYEYEEDTLPQGASTFRISESMKWAFSSTGDFVGDDSAPYIAQNTSLLHMNNSQLYMTARLSPLSLRYFGLCLQRGNYTVKLHFAELVFTDDNTYSSIGKRMFDVSIQGKKVLRDIDVAKEANGTNKEIIKSFTTVVNGTLDIHFQWGGKGTNLIPQRGAYGPIISAITVTPNFKPHIYDRKLSLSVILGIVTAIIVIIIVGLALLWFCLKRKVLMNKEIRGLALQTGYFSLRQIKAATNNFDPANKIGEGGFGPVYKGTLPDGSEVAVKQLSSKSKQGSREFINEVGLISALQHPNLVRLLGCSIDGDQLLLVYEYMQNNSLARALFGVEKEKLYLDWPARRKIGLGVAKGLAYLHEESRLKIVHRDIKATNILLDKDLTPKIADFGLAKLDEEEHSHISTRIAGTIGYMAPEYAMRGYLTEKADVYSFGVVILELVSGKSNTSYRHEEYVTLLDWAHVLQRQGKLIELVDPSLGSEYTREEALNMLDLSLVCTNSLPVLRPKMSDAVKMLEGKMVVQVPILKGAELNDEDRSQEEGTPFTDRWTDTSVRVPSDHSGEIEETPLVDRIAKTI